MCVFYRGLGLGMCLSVLHGLLKKQRSDKPCPPKKILPFAGDKETQMVTCHADSEVEDSKLASLFFYFCVTY